MSRQITRLLETLREVLGTRLVDHIGPQERLRHVRSALVICIICAPSFSLFNLFTPGMLALGVAEFLSLVLFFVPAFAILRDPQRIESAELLLMAGALFISSSLIIFGGIEGTGLFWVFSMPFLAFFIKGQRRGWYTSMFCYACHAACVWWVAPVMPGAYQFSPEVRLHFTMSMGFYVVVAAAFNHARSRFETALNQRKDDALAASQAKSRFLAAASHDLRQPAHALGLFVARLKQLPQDAQTQEIVAGVDASVLALQDMLDAYFDYSRLDAQLTRANPRNFSLNSVFDNLRRSFEDIANEKGLRLKVRPTQAWVHSDPVLLNRVLLNLLGNAVQYTHSGSILLACRVSAQGDSVRVEVRDSGIGIAPSQQARVFEEFYQIENPERDRSKGLGLGLSIVERACRLLDHRIELRSALGVGTTFTVHVPLGQALDTSTAEDRPEGHLTGSLQGMRVALVEDDPLSSSALSGLLQSWGCTVQSSATPLLALESWDNAHPPHFIISDYRLVGPHNGVAAVHLLRERAGSAMAACIVSGEADAAAKEAIQAAGLLLLQKPVKPAKLRSLLRHHWDGATWAR